MSSLRAEERAFPNPSGMSSGMLLRDYLAARAMEGLVRSMSEWVQSPDEIAVKAYELADAMLRASEVKP